MAQSSATIPTDQRTQATPTLYNNLVNDLTELYAGQYDTFAHDWIEVDDNWSYNTTSLISHDNTFPYYRSTPFKIRWKQGGDYEYSVARFATGTNVSKMPGWENWPTNAPITDTAISFGVSPLGWPRFFTRTFATSQLVSVSPLSETTLSTSLTQYNHIINYNMQLRADFDFDVTNAGTTLIFSTIDLIKSLISFSGYYHDGDSAVWNPLITTFLDTGSFTVFPANGAGFTVGAGRKIIIYMTYRAQG